jgi:hypothetical protein
MFTGIWLVKLPPLTPARKKRRGKTKGGIKGGEEKRRGDRGQEIKNFGVKRENFLFSYPNPIKPNQNLPKTNLKPT